MSGGDSPEHRARVREAIQRDVWLFLRDVLRRGGTFHESELIGEMRERHDCAHESPIRIMRDLRARNVVQVESVRRGTGQYQVRAINAVALEPMPRETEQLDMFGKGTS